MTLGAPKMARPFCAICTDEIGGEPIRSPLGKDDAMVDVCAACDGDKPIAMQGQVLLDYKDIDTEVVAVHA